MKIAGRARARKEIDEQAALGVGMKEKAEEFLASGADVYAKAQKGVTYGS